MTAATATAADPMAAVSPESRRAMAMTVARALRVLRIPSPMRLSQWAEKHFYLSTESSYVEGRWVCWPFQRGIMDVLGHDEIHHVTVRKSARVGYTKMALALLAYTAEHKRRNAVIYQPTDDDRDEFVTTELDPMLRDVRAMRSVMPRFSRRSKDNTLRVKKFTTGLLHMRGGKAAKNFRRLTVDTVVYDEFSGFDRDIEKEGSPGKLGDKRLEGAVWPKSIAGSTPKLKHNDNTEDREAEADVHLRWHVPCPHCGELHQITFGGKDKHHGLKWLPGDTASAVHICPHCGGAMSQAEYLRVWHAGVWICERTGQWLDHLGDFRAPQKACAPWCGNCSATPPPSCSRQAMWPCTSGRPARPRQPGPPLPKKPPPPAAWPSAGTCPCSRHSSTPPWAKHGKRRANPPTNTPCRPAPKTTR
jgi:phage terminase large subunit GpA-like protein